MKMKAHVNMVKGKATSRVSNQQAVFELKQRVVLALNKLADRDTYQIAVEELEKIVECLTLDGVAPFLSCILDTDCEKKSSVRKECIHLMGMLVDLHEGLVRPYLGKMVASIVKRLKDTDSAVRDSCVETFGVLSSKLSGGRTETDGIFVALVKPLFEALAEQNKQVQSGSALCLSRVIDNFHDPPPMVLQKMLSRAVKMLENPHFMAKPAVIELIRSIILAGGAPTHNSLSAALTSIQEALKNSDWGTRKAGCTALRDIASCGVACLGSFRSSSIRCLQSCRYDKVKPVREIALQALQLWRNLSGNNTPEPSEAGSSVKGTPYGDEYGDITSVSDSASKDIPLAKCGLELAKRKVPLSCGKDGRTYMEKSRTNDWHIKIVTPKNRNILAGKNQNDESDGCMATKGCERSNADVWSIKDIGYDYLEVEDKQETSSVCNTFAESIKSQVVKAHCDAFSDASLLKSTGSSQRFAADEVSMEEQSCLAKMHDHRSSDSTVTESTPHVMRCYSQIEKDMASIRNQLLEVENKQSNLMDMLKALTTTIVDSMSKVQMKVSNLELIVDKLAQELVHGRRYSDSLTKKGPSIVSPRHSTCTPRPSMDGSKQLPTKPMGIREDRIFTRSRSGSFRKQNSDMWTEATNKPSKSSGEDTPKNFYPEIHGGRMQKIDIVCNQVPSARARVRKLGTMNSPWKVVKDYLSEGDLDSAYVDALCSRDELFLFDLLDRTGPILEKLSKETASDLLSTLASYLLEQRFVNSIIPWLQQLVDLSNIQGSSYLALSAKTKRDFLSAILEAAKLGVFNVAERKFIIDLGKTLQQIWG